MTRKTWGVVLIAAGLILGVVSALADVLRIGALPDTFGVGQIGGLVVGAAVVVAGLYLLLGEGGAPESVEPEVAPEADDLTGSKASAPGFRPSCTRLLRRCRRRCRP